MNADPPPKDRRLLRRGETMRVSAAVIEGLRIQQKLPGGPDLDALLKAERQAAAVLALAVVEVRAKVLAR